MKFFIFVFLTLFQVFSHAQSEYFVITNISQGERDDYYHLESVDSELILDCSSFVHGIEIKKQGGKRFFYLYEPECYDIKASVKENTEREEKSCLELDFETHSWEVFTGSDTCQSYL